MSGTWFRCFVTGLALMSFTACSVMQPMEDFSPSRIRAEVRVGDKVQILASNKMTYVLDVTEVADTYLVGQAESGKRYKIRYEAMVRVMRSEVDAGATFAGIGATGVVLLTALFIILITSIDDTMDGC